MKPTLLLMFPLGAEFMAPVEARFEVLRADTPGTRDTAIARHGATVDAVLTTGAHGLTATEMDAMPKLCFVCAFGAGHEAVDVEAARARGIQAVNGPGTNDDCVADHALALLLNAVRGIGDMNWACRQGLWRDDLPMRDQLSGQRVGIFGLGQIGRKIARRLVAFDVEVGYYGRHRVEDVSYTYFAGLEALARWCDHLVVAAPGGDATRHRVDARVFHALGPRGLLVNVGRGSIVDTASLVDALDRRAIAGAALDVYEGEPDPPTALFRFDNVTLTPHAAGSSPSAMRAAVDLFLENARLHAAGEAVLTPL